MKITFGKYSGSSINKIMVNDPLYIKWMVENKLLKSTEEINMAIQTAIEEKDKREASNADKLKALLIDLNLPLPGEAFLLLDKLKTDCKKSEDLDKVIALIGTKHSPIRRHTLIPRIEQLLKAESDLGWTNNPVANGYY